MSGRSWRTGQRPVDLEGASDHVLRDVGLMRADPAPARSGLHPLTGLASTARRLLLPLRGTRPPSRMPLTEAELLGVARQTVARVPFCMAITVGSEGVANARVVHVQPPDEDWGVAFFTSRASRKAAEVEATGRLTLAYQRDAEGAYVTLRGEGRLDADPARKAAAWHRSLDRWFPGGPKDPDVAMVQLVTRRVELWSYARGVMPKPRGLRAAVVERTPDGWKVLTG